MARQKYKMIVEMDFESDEDLAEINVSGTFAALDNMMDGLPNPPSDLDPETATALVQIIKVAD